MKVNKPKSPFVSGTDAPDAKDIAKAVKGGKFAETLFALASGEVSENAALNAARETLAQIALQADLTNDESISEALRESAEFLIKSRLSETFKQTEQSDKMVKDLSDFVSDDPFVKAKLLSILQKLRDNGGAV